jgi:SRSO17 transposase
MDEESAGRVGSYFARVGKHLPLASQRESFATYAFGILGDGERKSVEPIAARATAEPEDASRAHDRLLHFIRESPWNDHIVRREAARYVIEALEKRERVTTWVIDDTGFLKQGRHSPGVQRQYTGSAGKVANCQLGVSLTIATATEHVPIDFRLYLPESWTEDAKRRKRARVPDSITFKSKVDLALDMISSAVEDGIPGDIVLADAFFGRSAEFRNTVEVLGLDYAVAVDGARCVRLVDAADNERGDEISAAALGKRVDRGAFRRVTWREGTRRKMSSRFLFRRVKVVNTGDLNSKTCKPLWLVIEWADGDREPKHFVLTNLRRRMTKKEIVRIIKERWKTERAYEELKGELGLDHFEGRSFVGWHHHVSVVLSCYAFVVAERTRLFPPSEAGARLSRALERAA